MYEKKLSIIIPTKNRQQYAFSCINAILMFVRSDFEVVVQDNSDDDTLRNLVSGIDDPRVVYNYVGECLPFCANFEIALENSSGDYFVYIGDDDGVLEDIFIAVDYARAHDVDAIRYSHNISYKWPNAVNNSANGELIIRDVIPKLKELDCSDAIDTMIKVGNYDYQNYNFPFAYHGIIKRSVFDQVKQTTGHYFGGLTPDIYAAVSLSFYVKKMIYIDYPFTIPGVCKKSGTADSLTGRHNGDLKDAPHFRGTVNYKWDTKVPYVYSVETIWAETAFKAMQENGREVQLSKEDYFNYLLHLVWHNPKAKKEYIDFYKRVTNDESDSLERRINYELKLLKLRSKYKRGKLFIKRVIIGRHVFKKVNDIGTAVEISQKHLHEKEIRNKLIQVL